MVSSSAPGADLENLNRNPGKQEIRRELGFRKSADQKIPSRDQAFVIFVSFVVKSDNWMQRHVALIPTRSDNGHTTRRT